MKYTVYVTRVSYSTVPIEINAESEIEAKATALDMAGDTIFEEDTADYEIESIKVQK
jgi:uncharacterized protein YacL (UPF0231 family)